MEASEYAIALQSYFSPFANEYNASRMRKYMLNQFDYFGIPSPQRKELTRNFITLKGLPDPEQLNETVRQVWVLPQRELHYVIMEIASRKNYLNNPDNIGLYEFMITTNSWWDTVDYIAANLVGACLTLHPKMTLAVTERFMASGNMWLQRTALLFQLKYKSRTNHELLYKYILQLNHSKEFFIRKAIGWSLREYSKTNPVSVLDFTQRTELSPLSRREALKIITKNKTG